MTTGDSRRSSGRPRASIDEAVFAATLRTIEDEGYSRATVDRIAAAAGVAKTTLYRRWPTKGELVTACVVDAFGPAPLTGSDPESDLEACIRWAAGRIALPGVGAAFAGVFTDAINQPELRRTIVADLQDPYRIALEAALGLDSERVLLLVDVSIGTMLHRLGITGRPMVHDDVGLLIEMATYLLRRELADASDTGA